METSVIPAGSTMTLLEQTEHLDALLDERFAELNELWKTVERHLIPIAYGQSCTHMYTAAVYTQGGPLVSSALGVQKIDGEWSLCHANYVADASHAWVPIHKCPAYIRLAAVIGVPGLYTAVLENSARLLPLCDRAITTLQQVLAPPSV